MNAPERPAASVTETQAPPLPRFVQIEPVGQCNLRCRMCPIAWRREGPPWGPPAFMPLDVFSRLIDGFPRIEELQLQGLGEPLMHPQFFAMVRLAADRGIRVSTNSNLTLMTDARARECVASGLDALHVSIDGATAETYESIRLRANFAKVLANLDRLVAQRAAHGGGLPRLRLVAVAMRRNLDELPGIVELAHARGVDTVFVQHLCHDFGESTLPAIYRPMRDFGAAESLQHESPERIERAFGAARSAAFRLGVDLRLPEPAGRPHRSPRGCDWPHHGAYIAWDGRAMPCCMVGTPDRATLGNMAADGVAAVWHGPAFRAFRQALTTDAPPEVCRGCAVYHGTF